jgi:hypothetical protein
MSRIEMYITIKEENMRDFRNNKGLELEIEIK